MVRTYNRDVCRIRSNMTKQEIEELEKAVKRAESRGQFDTAHHDLLKKVKGEIKKPEVKKEQEKINNG